MQNEETKNLNSVSPKKIPLRMKAGLRLNLPIVQQKQEFIRDNYAKVHSNISVGSFDAFNETKNNNTANFVCILPASITINKEQIVNSISNQNSKIENNEHFTKVDGRYYISSNISDEGFVQDIKSETDLSRETPSMQKFVDFFKKVASEIDLNKETFVNCQAGISRSVLLASCLACVKDGIEKGEEITNQKFLQTIKEIKEERYTKGYFKGRSIAETFAGEVKNPLKPQIEGRINFASNQSNLESDRLIKCAESNKFSFAEKLVDAINSEISKTLENKTQKSKNNGLTI